MHLSLSLYQQLRGRPEQLLQPVRHPDANSRAGRNGRGRHLYDYSITP
jgi:hypothetical protein